MPTNPNSVLDRVAARWSQITGSAGHSGPNKLQTGRFNTGPNTPFLSAMMRGGFGPNVLGSTMRSLNAFNSGANVMQRNPFGQQGANNLSRNPFGSGWNLPDSVTSDPDWYAHRYDKSWIQSKAAGGSGQLPSLGGDPSQASDGVGGVKQWGDVLDRVSKESGVPWQVLASIMAIESGGQNLSANEAGAVGLMQVIPTYWQNTANSYGGNLMDPYTNVRTAADILKMGYEKYGSWDKAAAFFNGGDGAFDANGNIIDKTDPYNGNTVGNYVSSFDNNMSYFGYGSSSAAEWATGGAPATQQANSALSFAMGVQGTPYVWGGADKNGFDCSGLTMWAYGQVGINIGRTAAEQYGNTHRINANQLQPGDLVFFSENGSNVTHVGLYVGNGQIVDAPSEGKTVRVVDLNTDWYRQHLFGYGRV